MSKTMTKPHSLLGSLTAARVEHNPVQMITRSASEPTKTVQRPAADAPAVKTAAWDPHEVWLSRVKEPREKRLA